MLCKDFTKSICDDFGINFTSMFNKANRTCKAKVAIKGIIFGNRKDSSLFPLFRYIVMG